MDAHEEEIKALFLPLLLKLHSRGGTRELVTCNNRPGDFIARYFRE